MPIADLIREADRQLTICNACRYCAGYCPVWPALELRTQLTTNDVVHLANLCHDCRDCFTACMYTAPHEFALNPPKVFAEVREHTYETYRWPAAARRIRPTPRLTGIAIVLAAVVLVVLSVLTGNGDNLFRSGDGDPYRIIGHWPLVATFTAAFAYAVAITVVAARRYWHDIHGSRTELWNLRSWNLALNDAARMRHYSGGEEGCSYPEGDPSAARKLWHQMLMYGFILAFASTTAAAIMENALGSHPPYPVLSVPVITGTVGGILGVAGCLGLLGLGRRADPAQTHQPMRRADNALLVALLTLMATGLATLVLRTTVTFGPMLIGHLACVLVGFLIAPYTKFVHWVYRLLSIKHDHLERARNT